MNQPGKPLVVLFLFFLIISGIKAQENVSDFLKLGNNYVSDIKILSEAYLRPYGDMLGKTLNGSWYNSANVHKLTGFDFTVGVSMAMAPGSKKNYNVSELLSKMEGGWVLKDNNVVMAPTVAGKNDIRPILTSEGVDVLTLPNGSGFDKFPMPMVQVGAGLPYHTEIIARFVPALEVGDAGKVTLFGVGVKHSIKEYIPVIRRIPFFNSSIMIGYTNFESEIGVSYLSGNNQKLNIKSTGLTSRLIIGANFPMLALYAGLGYGSASSDFGLKGSYEGFNDNPVSFSYSTSGFDANAGLRLRFGLIAIHADYTIGDYNMASVGLGLSFR